MYELDEDYLTKWIEASYIVAGWWPQVEELDGNSG